MPSFKFVCSLQVCVFLSTIYRPKRKEGEEKKKKTRLKFLSEQKLGVRVDDVTIIFLKMPDVFIITIIINFIFKIPIHFVSVKVTSGHLKVISETILPHDHQK